MPGKRHQCEGEPGSAEKRRAEKTALRIRADTKTENGNIFAEVLTVFILKEHMRFSTIKQSENSLFFQEKSIHELTTS